MISLTRRKAVAALSALTFPALAFTKTKGRVVIIGGGFGGASAALALKRFAPSLDVTLIEPNKTYYSCPFSNLVMSGERDIKAQAFGYEGLEARGIHIIHDYAYDVDPINRSVKTRETQITLPYDRLILSPGISMKWKAIEGYDKNATTLMPHGWKAGAQTLLLKQKLSDLDNGSTIVISVPPAPYRCPPGPYERASLIAHYLKTHKPRSKLIILDAKDSFSKQALFEQAWAEDYADILEWRPASFDGIVQRVEPENGLVFTDFETIKADMANIIPPQKAAEIAARTGVTDSTQWCPINATNFESTLQDNIHIIGDAAIANPMPKSAFSANLQAKLCAIQIVRQLSGLKSFPTTLTNTCYSYISPNKAVSITGVYKNTGGQFSQIPAAGGTSELNALNEERIKEGLEAKDWFNAITQEAFG